MFSTKDARKGVAVVGVAAAVALVAALATYAVARAADAPLLVNGPAGVTEVPAGAVALATVTGALAAWAVALGSARTARPRTVFTTVIGLGLLLSSVPPVVGATTGSTTRWLLLMHLVVAVPLVTAGWRLLPAPAGPRR